MVNSPSRPNLRPPAPVECGGMTPLWNRETCLPVDRAGLPKACPRAGRGRPRHRFPAPRPEIREPRPDFPLPSRQNQGSIKAKTPAIKAYQAISRQTRKFPMAPGIPPWNSPSVSIRVYLRSKFLFASFASFAVPRPCACPKSETRFSLPSRLNQGKNPSNQGSSSHIKANAKISHGTRHSAPELPHLCPSAFICGQSPLPNSPFASLRLCAFALKPSNQALSNQIKANAIPFAPQIVCFP